MVYCRVLLRALSGAQPWGPRVTALPGVLEPHPGLGLWPLVPSRCAGLKRTRLRGGGGRGGRGAQPKGCSDLRGGRSGHVGVGSTKR